MWVRPNDVSPTPYLTGPTLFLSNIRVLWKIMFDSSLCVYGNVFVGEGKDLL